MADLPPLFLGLLETSLYMGRDVLVKLKLPVGYLCIKNSALDSRERFR